MARFTGRFEVRCAIFLLASPFPGCQGCGPSPHFSVGPGIARPLPQFVHEIPATAPLPLERDAAVLVFVRPSGAAPLAMPAIVDERGRYLGTTVAASYFAATLPPGDHTFALCTTDGAVLRAHLAPGKRYFVEVTVSQLFTTTGRLAPIRPRSEHWGDLTRWYVEKKHLVADEAAGQADLGERAVSCARAGSGDDPPGTIGPDDGE